MTAQAICFDLDDTLYDYHEYAEAGLRGAAEVLEARTGEAHFEELRALYFDAGVTSGTFDRVLEEYNLPTSLVETLVAAYHGATTPLAPYDGTETVLATLSPDHRLGLITDGRGGHAKLQRLGIRRYFDSILVTPTIGKSKHDPTDGCDAGGVRTASAVSLIRRYSPSILSRILRCRAGIRRSVQMIRSNPDKIVL